VPQVLVLISVMWPVNLDYITSLKKKKEILSSASNVRPSQNDFHDERTYY
jgi:hypothetical protein